MNVSKSFPVGSKVRVVGFPAPMHQSLPFDYNGLTGVVKQAERVGVGLGGLPVYSYLVRFDDVQVPYSMPNPETGKIDRGIRKSSAEGFFEEVYLERAE
jgi:hypothetical protein